MTNYRDIKDEIRSRQGYDAAERYEREIERDGHSLYESVYSRARAVDGCRDWENERNAEEAYRRLDDDRRGQEMAAAERQEAEQRRRAYEAREEQRMQEEQYQQEQYPEPSDEGLVPEEGK